MSDWTTLLKGQFTQLSHLDHRDRGAKKTVTVAVGGGHLIGTLPQLGIV